MRDVIAIAVCGLFAAAWTPACASVIGLDELHRSTGASDGGVGASGASGSGGGSGGASGDGTSSTSVATGDSCGQHPGPAMVRVSVGGDSFCVDATEVTNDQYAAFLATHPSTSQIDGCNGNGDLHPTGPPAGAGGDPATWVSWCGAAAYCAWAGEALCGKVSGGSLDPSDAPTKGEWFTACDAGALGGATLGEWEDSCSGDNDDDSCSVRGVACDARRMVTRMQPSADVGFRCCGS